MIDQDIITKSFMKFACNRRYVVEEVVYIQPPNPNAKPIPTRIAVPTKKIDQINELTIKGYIEDLTLCIDDQNSRFTSSFKEIYFPRPQGEDPCPFKFTHLEKVDLSGCICLIKLDWMFIYNGKIRNVILPDYDFTATGNDWISQYNEDLILEEDEPLRIKINNDHAIYNSPIETGGCCNIA